MKYLVVSLLILIGTLSVFAQKDIIVLHPAIGDTIDLAEKQTYLLFADIEDSSFESGQIIKLDDKYFLKVYYQSEEELVEVDRSKLEEYHTNIQKLLAYYTYLENPDKLKVAPLVVLNQKDTCALEMDIEYLSPKMRKKLKYDSSQYQNKKSTAEEMEFWVTSKSNYIHTSGYFEILDSKGK